MKRNSVLQQHVVLLRHPASCCKSFQVSRAWCLAPDMDNSPAYRSSLWTAPAGCVTWQRLTGGCLRPDALRLPTAVLNFDSEMQKNSGHGVQHTDSQYLFRELWRISAGK